jgi:hypothetical protein
MLKPKVGRLQQPVLGTRGWQTCMPYKLRKNGYEATAPRSRKKAPRGVKRVAKV